MQQQRNNNLLFFFLIVSLLLFLYIPLRQRFFPTPEVEPEKTTTTVRARDEPRKDDSPLRLPPPPKATPTSRLLALGSGDADSPFQLRVLLDPLGGGVRSVILNKFQESDRNGRPTGQPLELIPGEANEHEPSHLLYHFSPRDTDWAPLPLDTLGRRVWTVLEEGGKTVVTENLEPRRIREKVSFQTEIDGVRVTKTYSLTQGEYHLGLQVKMERITGGNGAPRDREPVAFRYQLTGAKGLPVEGKWYTSTFQNALIALEDDRGNIDRRLQDLRQIDLWMGGNAVNREDNNLIRYAGVAVQYFAAMIVVDDQQDDQRFLRRATPTLETGVARGRAAAGKGDPALIDTVVVTSDDGKTRQTIHVPPGAVELRAKLAFVREGQPIAVLYRSLSYDPERKEAPRIALDVRVGTEAEAMHPLWYDDITVRVATEPATLKPGGDPAIHQYLLYYGPVKPSLLRQLRGERDVEEALVERYATTLHLNTMTDYQSPGWMGNFASSIYWTALVIKCTNLMHWVLAKVNLVSPNYGLSIIVLTVLVRLLMFPLSRKQALMGLKMQALQPELKKLKEKYRDDNQAFAQAQMALFREHGVNPFGSCWVILLQMPIFMGLYFALQESIQFRLAGFWPTWIENLAAPDMLLYWGRSIPLLSRDADYGGLIYLGPYLNLLPFFAVALMVIQQKMMTPPPADKEQEMQHRMMRIMMIVFGLFFYKVAAGLCIYIITSTLWGFAERKFLPKSKTPKVDLDLDSRVAAAAGTSPATSTAVTVPGQVAADPRKPGRSKRRERGRATPRPAEQDQPATRLGQLQQRLRNWWNDVLEQARKK